MTRKMTYAGFSYLAGSFFAYFFDLVPKLILVALSLTVFCYCFFFQKPKKLVLSVMAFFFGLAVLLNVLYTHCKYEKVISYDGKTVEFQGEIVDFSDVGSDMIMVTAKGTLDGKIKAKVNIYTENKEFDYYDTIKVKAKFSKFENSLTFSGENYYKSNGIFLAAFNCESVEIISNDDFNIFREILNYRDYSVKKIRRILPGDVGGILVGMVCGDTRFIPKDTELMFYRSGIGHIFSVSGTHTVIVAFALIGFLTAIGVGKRLRFILTELVLFSFVIFSGLSLSSIRAAVMMTIVLLGEVSFRKADTFNSLGICAMVMSVINPFVVINYSFLLSFMGAFGIGVVSPKIVQILDLKGSGKLLKSVIAMITVSVCALPLYVLLNDEISLISPITNVFLIPICTVAMVLAFVCVALGFLPIVTNVLLFVSGLLTRLVTLISSIIVKLPYSFIGVSGRYLTVFVLVFTFTVILFVLAKKYKLSIMIALASIGVLFIGAFSNALIEKDDLKIAILSEQNSSSVVIYKNGESAIIDFSGAKDMSYACDKLLRRNGIKNLDFVFLLNNPTSSISKYVSNLSLTPSVYLSYDDLGIDVSEMKTQVLRIGDKINFHGVEINLCDNGEFVLLYKDKRVVLGKSNDSITNINHDLGVFLGKNFYISMNEEIYKLSNSENGVALTATVKENGKITLRRSENAFRE